MAHPRPRGRCWPARVAWCPTPTLGGARLVSELGPNAYGEVLDPGRVAACYLGLLLPAPPAGEPEPGRVLVVAPRARCCTPASPSRPGAWSMS